MSIKLSETLNAAVKPTELFTSSDGSRVLMLPHGGDLLVPTYVHATPKLYFGDIPASDLIVTDRLTRYKMRQTGEHKLGIRAVVTAGRVGYIYQTDDKWALTVRSFQVNPSGEYIDVPWNDLTDLGYSAQACNVNSGLGRGYRAQTQHAPSADRSEAGCAADMHKRQVREPGFAAGG